MSKEGVVNLYAGWTGSGKSPKIRELVRETPMLNQVVFDPNYEQEPNRSWQKEGNYPYDKWTVYHEWDELMRNLPKIYSSHLVMEDATSELSSMAEKDIRKMLVAIEHRNNVAHMVFHGLIDIPPVCLRNAHFLYLFHTEDDESSVKTSRKKYYPYFMEMQKNTDNSAWILFDIRNRLITRGTGAIMEG